MNFWALAGLLIIVFILGFVIGLFQGMALMEDK